jgi:hypothetical protein
MSADRVDDFGQFVPSWASRPRDEIRNAWDRVGERDGGVAISNALDPWHPDALTPTNREAIAAFEAMPVEDRAAILDEATATDRAMHRDQEAER